MTASKPPDKTLVGMPNDLQAILQKLEQEKAGAAEPATLIEQPVLQQPNNRPRTVPPPLPGRPGLSPVQPAAPPSATPGNDLDRTLIGMPSDMQAALQKAIADQTAGNPQPAAAPRYARTVVTQAQAQAQAPVRVQRQPVQPQPEPEPIAVLRVQPVRAVGVGGAAVEPQARAVPVVPQQPPARPGLAQPPAASHAQPAQASYAQQPPAASHAHAAQASYAQQQSPAASHAPAAQASYAQQQPPAASHAHAAQPAQPSYAQQPPAASHAHAGAAQSAQPSYAPAAHAHSGAAQQPPAYNAPSGGLGQQGVPSASPPPPQPEAAPIDLGSTANGLKVFAPQAPLDWPPAARPPTDSQMLARHEVLRTSPSLQPAPAERSTPTARRPTDQGVPALPPHPPQSTAASAPAHDDSPMQATRLATFETGSVPGAREPRSSSAPRLALQPPPPPEDEAPKHEQPKRWPALSLIALAVLAFGGVIVVRAPHLLPQPLAALLGGAPPPQHVDAPTLPAVKEAPAQQQLTTDTSAATALSKAPPTPFRPPAAPPMTAGASAQLEKRAIERLIANDYPAAKQLYEKLASAEPSRTEFAVMVELLARSTAAGVGP